MMLEDTTPLKAETDAAVRAIGKADILVGLSSFNNVETIGAVIQALCAGLVKYFPDMIAVVANSDGGSVDGTPEAVSRAVAACGAKLIRDQQGPLHKTMTPAQGVPGRGIAFRTLFEIARRLQVQACVVVDPDHRSVTPAWIDLLIRPVLEQGYDYIAPYYLRHKYDGLIVNNLVYPLLQALYGRRIRYPIGGDVGLSGSLMVHYLGKRGWEADVTRFDPEIWMVTEAIASGARIGQSFLGPKVHDRKDLEPGPAEILPQIMGRLFDLMDEYHAVWTRKTAPTAVPVFGFQYEVGIEPVEINVEPMIMTFRHGLVALRDLWAQMLAPETLQQLLVLEQGPLASFSLPEGLWSRIVYELAIGYHRRRLPREHLLKAVTPLYLARTASFVLATQGLTSREAERRIEMLSQAFENQKSYLVERW